MKNFGKGKRALTARKTQSANMSTWKKGTISNINQSIARVKGLIKENYRHQGSYERPQRNEGTKPAHQL